MCSTPKTGNIAANTPTIATPTTADASVTKAKNNQRAAAEKTSTKNAIKTSSRGVADEATTQKKKLLGE